MSSFKHWHKAFYCILYWYCKVMERRICFQSTWKKGQETAHNNELSAAPTWASLYLHLQVMERRGEEGSVEWKEGGKGSKEGQEKQLRRQMKDQMKRQHSHTHTRTHTGTHTHTQVYKHIQHTALTHWNRSQTTALRYISKCTHINTLANRHTWNWQKEFKRKHEGWTLL